MKKFFQKNLKSFLFISIAVIMNFTFIIVDALTYSEKYELNFSINKWRHYTILTDDYYFSGNTLRYLNEDNKWISVKNVKIDNIEYLGGK